MCTNRYVLYPLPASFMHLTASQAETIREGTSARTFTTVGTRKPYGPKS